MDLKTFLQWCGRQNNGPLKDAHALIPGACEYITFHGKRNFKDVIKGMYLEMWTLFWIIQVDPI